MNYGDHNFIEITQQTKLQVEPVELDFVERVDRRSTRSTKSSASSESSQSCRACRAVLFDNVNTAKMHGLDTSNVSSRAKWNLALIKTV